MGKMFDLLKEGLEEAIEYHKENVKLRTKKAFIPDSPKNYQAKDIKNLRSKLDVTQQELATWLNTSLNTVQAWEQGMLNPGHSALRLLEVFDKDFSSIEEILKPKKDTRSSRKKGVFISHGSSKTRIITKDR